MFTGFPLFPEQASTVAGEVDRLYFFLVGISLFFGLLIASLLVTFAVRYRRRSESELPRPIHGSVGLELAWTLIPLGIVLVIFVWATRLYVSMNRVPPGAMEIHVVGKRWMWKAQHMTGQREINALHVPVGVPVKLLLASEDVIHSFFVPAFRIKKDVVPGRYNSIWFEASRTGTYRLFCAEYCGTKHSQMIGSVTVLEPAQFQRWLAGGANTLPVTAAGEKLFNELACANCHRADSQARGPALDGIVGRPVRLAGGASVVADEEYLRESILNPAGKLVEGYQPIMPTYQGLVSEEGLMQLIAYIRSLSPAAARGAREPEQQPGMPPAPSDPVRGDPKR